MYNFPQVNVSNGRAKMKRRRKKKYGNGIIVDTGNSYELNRNALSKFFDELAANGAAWVPSETIFYRENCITTSQLYLQAVYHSEIVHGWSDLHYSQYDWTKVIFDEDKGVNYIQFSPIEVQVHADGGPVSNVPRQYHSMCVVWLKFDILKEHLTNSFYSGIPILLSALSEDNPNVKHQYDQLINQMGKNGTFTFWDKNHNCEIRIPWNLVFCGDLKIRNSWCNQAMTVGSKFGIVQAVKIDTENEDFPIKGISQEEFSYTLFYKYASNDTISPLTQWDEEKIDCYTTLNNEYHSILANRVETAYKDYCRSHDIQTEDERIKVRKNIAKSQGHCIYELGNALSGSEICDIKHCFWSWYKYVFAVCISVFANIWKWSQEAILNCTKSFDLTILDVQIQQYFNKTYRKNSLKKCSVNCHGDDVNVMNRNWTKFMQHASYQCQNDTQRVNLALIYTITKLMRSVFSTLHKSRFEKNSNDESPEIIQDAMYNAMLAYYIAENCMDSLVCLHFS